MSGYFKFFPKITYPYQGKLVGTASDQITSIECTDLMVRYRIKEEILRSPLSYYVYQWKDTDRPDSVAFDYYGSVEYAWLVIFSAQVFDYIYDFPLEYSSFLEYLKESYEVDEPFTLQSVLHHYEDGDGDWLDQASYLASTDMGKKEVSVFDYEFQENEKRRSVKLLSRKFLVDISKEFEDSLKSVKSLRKESLAQFIIGSN